VGITNILTGAFTENIESLNTNLEEVLFASFSYPGFFPPAESMGSSWFDGSVISDLDIFSAVNKCLETHADVDVVVDVVMTSRRNLKPVDASNFNSLQMLFRYLEISRYYGVMDSLLRAQFAYPHITFRYLVSPSSDLPSSLLPLVSLFDVKIVNLEPRTKLS
jgi:predicted acylesterase/phospholipase RssA